MAEEWDVKRTELKREVSNRIKMSFFLDFCDRITVCFSGERMSNQNGNNAGKITQALVHSVCHDMLVLTYLFVTDCHDCF